MQIIIMQEFYICCLTQKLFPLDQTSVVIVNILTISHTEEIMLISAVI